MFRVFYLENMGNVTKKSSLIMFEPTFAYSNSQRSTNANCYVQRPEVNCTVLYFKSPKTF